MKTETPPLDLEAIREHLFDSEQPRRSDALMLIAEVERLRKQIAEAKDALETASIHSNF